MPTWVCPSLKWGGRNPRLRSQVGTLLGLDWVIFNIFPRKGAPFGRFLLAPGHDENLGTYITAIHEAVKGEAFCHFLGNQLKGSPCFSGFQMKPVTFFRMAQRRDGLGSQQVHTNT